MKPNILIPISALCFIVAGYLPLTASASVTFADPLDHQTGNWTPNTIGTGSSVSYSGGKLQISFTDTCTPAEGTDQISAMCRPSFELVGDFDAQVDYQETPYKPSGRFQVSGLRVQLAFNMCSAERVGWENVGHEVYTANHYWNISTVPTSDVSGTLRLVRKGGLISSYYKSDTGWALIKTSQLHGQDLEPVHVTLSSGFTSYAYPGVAMTAAFSNFKVTADDIISLQSGTPLPQPVALVKPQTLAAPTSVAVSSASLKSIHLSSTATPLAANSAPVILSAPVALGIQMAPALSLSGDVGADYLVQFSNAVGPTNTWTSLGTVTLTNNPQYYFDPTAIGQPARYYRLMKVQ